MNLVAVTHPTALPAVTLAERVYSQIKQLIFDFVLLPGDRFSESDLANQVQVSRTPLRLYDLRVLIETHAVARLCEVEERPALKELADIWLIKPSERQTAFITVDKLDEGFHSALVRAIGNSEMARVHEDITERIRIIRRLDFTKPARVEATYDEHARILRAITRRRADEAQRLLKAHVAQSKAEVRHITLDMLYQARQRIAAGA